MSETQKYNAQYSSHLHYPIFSHYILHFLSALEMDGKLSDQIQINPQMIYCSDLSKQQLGEVTVKVLHFIHLFYFTASGL